MKKPWSDGTVALLFEPLDLIARLCALVPPPGFHMVRYHGLFAPNAKLRAEVVPAPPSGAAPKLPTAPQLELDLWGPTATARPRRKPWAWLLKHVFAEDLAACERCGGPTRWLDVATEPDHIAALLARHELDPPARSPPTRARRRLPSGQLELGFG